MVKTMHMLLTLVCASVTRAYAEPAYSDPAHADAYPHDREKRSLINTGPVTVSPSGAFRGSWMTSRKGRVFESYRNIPYAEPPVGLLRFEPPRPITNYSEVVDATADGPICPQPQVPQSPGPIDEDCLKLNVYTPGKSSQLLPVVVVIPYGGFFVVSGRSDVSGARYLLDQELVVVSFNFRLSSLGFLSTGDKLAPGNNGFKDQVMVFRWVQRNIAAFGGNPSNILLLGCGTGAYSIALHLVSPMSKGLFHAAVAISGSPFSQKQIGTNQRDLATKQAQLVNCPTSTSQAIIDCLRTKTWKEIADSLNGFIEFPTDHVLSWSVVVESDFGQERFMPSDPLTALRSGQLYSVPLIISQARDEYSWLANIILNNATLTNMLNKDFNKYAPLAFSLPSTALLQADALRHKYLGDKQLARDSESLTNLGKFFGDALIGFSAHRLVNLLGQNSKSPVYYYQLDYVGNNSFYKDPFTNLAVGVAHHDDLIYLQSMPGLFPDIGLDGSDAMLVDRMTAIINNFARYGDPNPRGNSQVLSNLSWPRFVPSNRSYLRISTGFSVSQNLYEDRFSVWDSLFPIVYTPLPQIQLPNVTINLNISSLLDIFSFLG